MALKAGYKGIKKCGPGLKYDNLTGTLKLDGEMDLTLDNLKDVNITTPADGDYLTYDPTNEEWYNEQPDSTPTEDSPNLVTSGGVYAAIEDVDVTDLIPEDASSSNKLATASDVNDLWSANAVLGAKNRLPIKLSEVKASNTTGTWSGNTYTISGVAVEFTAVGDYVTQVKLNGTASANITTLFLNTHLNIKAGSYKCNGNPSGVTGNQYGLRIATANFSVNTFFEQDATLNLANDTSDLMVDIRIPSGQVIDNEIFKPMIRLASDTDSTYAPYAMTNGELTEAVIKRTTGTATTSANGNFNTNLRVDECVVIGAYPTGTGADYALIPCRWDGTYWGLSARKPLTTWDVPANTQIDYIIWYAEV